MNSSGMVEITCDPWSEWKKSLLLAWYLARRNLNVRYRGSVLGYFWGLTYPLMLMVIYIMVFSQILRPDLSENAFAVNFLPAMFAWLWIANVMSHSVFSISQMSSVLHQTFFPRWIIPLATVLAEGVNYVLSVPLLVGGLAALGVFPGWGLLWLLALVPLLLVFTFGIALAISPVAVIYRDTQYLVELIIRVLFFLSPIIYTLESVKDMGMLRWITTVNMLSYIVEFSRPCFLEYPLRPDVVWGAGAAAVLSLAIGGFVFSRHANRVSLFI